MPTDKKVIKLTKQRLESLKKNVAGLSSELSELHILTNLDGSAIRKALDKVKKDLDSMSDMEEIESPRLQMAMDRTSKLINALSNLLKKISDVSSEITQNLK